MKSSPLKPIFLTVYLSLFIPGFLTGQIKSDFLLVKDGSAPFLFSGGRGDIDLIWRESYGSNLYHSRYDSMFIQKGETHYIGIGGPAPAQSLTYAIGKSYTRIVWRHNHVVLDYSEIKTTILSNVSQPSEGLIRVDYSKDGLLNYSSYPDVTYIDDSTAVVVWISWGYYNRVIYGQYVTDSDRLIGQNFVINDRDLSADEFILPRVCNLDPQVGFLVVWTEQRDTTDYCVYGRILRPDGSPPYSSFLISDPQGMKDIWCLDIMNNSKGNISVVWSTWNNDEFQMWTCELDHTGKLLGESKMLVSEIGMEHRPNYAFDELDRFVTIHERSVNDTTVLYAQRFDAEGLKIGTEFRLNQAGYLRPSVILVDGKIYTAWKMIDSSYNGDIWANIIDFENVNSVHAKDPFIGVDASALYQNYPNPFNSETTIEYEVRGPERIRLRVYDTLGKEIITLVNEKQSSGRYSVKLQTHNLSSGVYLVELLTPSYRQRRKMILVR